MIAFKKEIRTIFADIKDLQVYSKPNPQGVEMPFFQVRIVDASQERLLANHWWYTQRVSIAYVANAPTHEHLQDVRERLLFDMDEVPWEYPEPVVPRPVDEYGDPIPPFVLRAENPEAPLVEDSIVFTATYTILVKRDRIPEPLMDAIEHKIYTDIPTYEADVDPIRNPDPWMWRWEENDDPYRSDEEWGLMEEIENEKDIIP